MVLLFGIIGVFCLRTCIFIRDEIAWKKFLKSERSKKWLEQDNNMNEEIKIITMEDIPKSNETKNINNHKYKRSFWWLLNNLSNPKTIICCGCCNCKCKFCSDEEKLINIDTNINIENQLHNNSICLKGDLEVKIYKTELNKIQIDII